MSIARKILMGSSGGKKSTYVDDVFSTYIYEGTQTEKTITNGIDLAGEGGMVWIKNRVGSWGNNIFDTERGTGKLIRANTNSAYSQASFTLNAFNSDGFGLGNDSMTNANGGTTVSYSFRKTSGFFDVVTYTGNGVDGRSISHSLGCIPGMWMVKRTDGTGSWVVGHSRILGGTGDDYKWHVLLNSDAAKDVNGEFTYSSPPTATTLSLGSSSAVNGDGNTYVAYLFAGGESTAATARSVEFDSTFPGEDLSIASSGDFEYGTGDFTWEAYFKATDISSNKYILNHRTASGPAGGIYIHQSNQTVAYGNGSGSGDNILGNRKVYKGQWYHVAVSRNSNVTRLFLDGLLVGTGTHDDYSFPASTFWIGTDYGATSQCFDGNISNVRIIKGTGLYTSSFKPSTEPLTNVTNTKLLCCNNSSVTGSTVTPGTITSPNNTPTASTDSPFDDPDGFKFGADSDNLEGIIKTGSYVGNSTANHEIYLGWEPQYWLVKNVTDNSTNWQLLDTMRGWIVDGNDQYIAPNNNSADSAFNFGNPTPTGFNLSNASSNWQNESGKTYIYMAIRRPDGVVGKPPSAATDVFTMVTGDDTVEPSFAANFDVDFSFTRKPVSSYGMVNINRLTGTNEMFFYNDDVTAGADGDYALDYNNGFAKNRNNTYQSWMWKRSAGMDVVYDYITASQGYKGIGHNLNAIPEMIIVKSYTGSDDDWIVYNKYLNGGTNSNDYYLALNKSDEENSVSGWLEATPTATSFSLQTNYRYTGWHSFQLFASANDADGNPISKVGTYVGDGTTNGSKVITLGFEPRFILIKGVDNGTHNWDIFDSIRGFGAGVATNYLQLNNSNTQADAGTGLLEKSTTSFTVGCNGVSGWNSNGRRHIYYAHA